MTCSSDIATVTETILLQQALLREQHYSSTLLTFVIAQLIAMLILQLFGLKRETKS